MLALILITTTTAEEEPMYFSITINGKDSQNVIVNQAATITFYGTELTPQSDAAKLISEGAESCARGSPAGGVSDKIPLEGHEVTSFVTWTITVRKAAMYRVCYLHNEKWTEVSKGSAPVTTSAPQPTAEPSDSNATQAPTATPSPDPNCPSLPPNVKQMPFVGITIAVMQEQFTSMLDRMPDLLCIPRGSINTVHLATSHSRLSHWTFVIQCPISQPCDKVMLYNHIVSSMDSTRVTWLTLLGAKEVSGVYTLPLDVRPTETFTFFFLFLFLTMLSGSLAFAAYYYYQKRRLLLDGVQSHEYSMLDAEVEDFFPTDGYANAGEPASPVEFVEVEE